MHKFIKSFLWAINGLRTVWQEEVALVIALFAMWLRFSALEWILLFMCIAGVLAAEIINTAIEDLCDRVEYSHDPIIGKIKDTMAGFVLIVALFAVIVGLILFTGHF